METREIVLLVLVFILLLAVIILTSLTIYYSTRDCSCMCDGTYDEGDSPYISPNYTHYNAGDTCKELRDSSNWIDFDIVNNSDTSVVIYSNRTSQDSDCSINYMYNIFNWNIPASSTKYNSKCVQGVPLGYLTLFKDMYILVKDSARNVDMAISYNGGSITTGDVQLSNIDPKKQKVSIVVSGNSPDTYLAEINVKNRE